MPANAQATASLDIVLSGTYTRTGDPLSAPIDRPRAQHSQSFTNGTGSGKVGILHQVRVTLSASQQTSIDLAAGLTDVFGNTLTFTKIKALWIKNSSVNAATVVRVGGGSNGSGLNAAKIMFVDTTDMIDLPQGWAIGIGGAADAPTAITAGTADLLGLKNNDGTNQALVDILIAGESA